MYTHTHDSCSQPSSLSVRQLHLPFLGSSPNARWDQRPAPLSSENQVQPGIFCLPFYHQRFQTWRAWYRLLLVFISWTRRADCRFAWFNADVLPLLGISEWRCICVLASVCEQKDQLAGSTPRAWLQSSSGLRLRLRCSGCQEEILSLWRSLV